MVDKQFRAGLLLPDETVAAAVTDRAVRDHRQYIGPWAEFEYRHRIRLFIDLF
jgi:hypothetical protein